MENLIFLMTMFLAVSCNYNQQPCASQDPVTYTWEKHLSDQISVNLNDFKKAKDWDLYCQNWDKLNDEQKVSVIKHLTLEICKYESDCKPEAISPDDVDGTASIGLYQLSYEDDMKWCSMNSKLKNLTDPYVNIDCAIPKMGQLIAENETVAQGQVKGTRRGLARYWSVMWPGTRQGHLNQIKASVNGNKLCR